MSEPCMNIIYIRSNLIPLHFHQEIYTKNICRTSSSVAGFINRGRPECLYDYIEFLENFSHVKVEEALQRIEIIVFLGLLFES